MPANQEIKYDPNASVAESDAYLEEDLGDHDSFVDKLEAEEAAASGEDRLGDDGQAELETDGAFEEEASGEEEVDEEEDGEEEDELDEEDEEDDEESEPEEDIKPEDELADPTENPVVPRERLNAANRRTQEEASRANKLEQEINQLKAQMEASAEDAGITNIDQSKLKEAAEKALDGDTDAFSNLLSEQMAAITKNMTATQEKLMEKARQDAVAEVRAEQLQKERREQAAVWEEIYPELDPNGDNLNEDALAEAVDLMGIYEAKGYSPSVAMERAVRAVAVNFELEPAADTTVTTTKPVKNKKVVKKRAKKQPVNQPPATGKGGTGKTQNPGIDPSAMSQDEWDALPESTRERYLNS